MNYGIPYKGSKSKIAQQIINCIPSAENFYDLFGGGGAITHCAILEGRWKNYVLNDISDGLTKLFVDAISGKYKNENRFISREQFYEQKDKDAFIRYIWSFGNNGRSYLYGKNIEKIKHLGHNAVVFNDIYPLEEYLSMDLSELYKVDNFRDRKRYIMSLYKKSKRAKGLERLQHLGHLHRLEQLERLERLQQLQRLDNISNKLINLNQDYRNVEIKSNSVIYCDIPYKDTEGYERKTNKSSFDYDSFYNWCEKQTEPVFISEYAMPDNRFKCIMEIEKTSCYSATNNNKKTVEKLFIPRCQEDVSIKQLSLF